MFSKSDGATALEAALVRALSFSVAKIELDSGDGPEPTVAGLAGVWNGDKGFVAAVVRRIPSKVVDRYLYADPIDAEEELKVAVEDGLAFLESMGFHMDPSDFVGLSETLQEQRLAVWDKLRKVRRRYRPRNADPPPPEPDPATPPTAETVPPEEEAPDEVDFKYLAGDIDPNEDVTPLTALDVGAITREILEQANEAEKADDADEADAAEKAADAEGAEDAEKAADADDSELPSRIESSEDDSNLSDGRAVLARIALVRRSGDSGRPGAVARLLSFF